MRICLEGVLKWATVKLLQTQEIALFFTKCATKQSCYSKYQKKNLFLPDASELTQTLVRDILIFFSLSWIKYSIVDRWLCSTGNINKRIPICIRFVARISRRGNVHTSPPTKIAYVLSTSIDDTSRSKDQLDKPISSFGRKMMKSSRQILC